MFSIIFGGTIVFFLLKAGEGFQCPNESAYIQILSMGCYKVYTGVNATWNEARETCKNDVNSSTINGIAHLLSIEHQMKMNAISNWLQAYNLFQSFWIDGDFHSSKWTWSNQSITWFFASQYRSITGKGTKYKLSYNPNISELLKYQISDDNEQTQITYICEYQVPCIGNSSCQNNAQCYVNMGQDLCICAPGFTGELCEINIDECLEAPCLNGGNCTDGNNNYTCDCTNTYHEGFNCEIEQTDPTAGDRKTAFWSVLGVVIGLIVFLTLSDLPWEDIISALGCSFHCFGCCPSKNKEEDSNENDLDQTDSPIVYEGYGGKKLSLPDETSAPRTTNYQIMNTTWTPEYTNNRFNSSKASSPVSSFQQNQQVYAVNVNQPKSRSNDSVDAMANWSKQLQHQLKNPRPHQSSADSTKQLIHKTYSSDA